MMLRLTFILSALFLAKALSPSSNVGSDHPSPTARGVSFTRTSATTLASVATVAMVTFLSSPVAAADVGEGKVLFQANCAGCHAGGQNFVSEKKTLFRDALEKYRTTDPVKLQDFVQKGIQHRMLPRKFSSDQDYASVIAFVLDQALGEKWE